jgi:hypothetical protein
MRIIGIVSRNADHDAHYHATTRPRDSSCDADLWGLIRPLGKPNQSKAHFSPKWQVSGEVNACSAEFLAVLVDDASRLSQFV